MPIFAQNIVSLCTYNLDHYIPFEGKCHFAENWRKLAKVAENWRKLAKVAENWRKLAKVAENSAHNIDRRLTCTLLGMAPRSRSLSTLTTAFALTAQWSALTPCHDLCGGKN
jgi:hypothetical protein